MKPLASWRISGLLGVWELRASALGLTQVAVPSRVGLLPPLFLSSEDEEESVECARAHLALAAEEFEAYFAGTLQKFSCPLDRLSSQASFTARVHHALSEIPYGSVVSYGKLAAWAGSARGVRAVGTACGRNPLPVVVPCHRVVRADGSLGEYTGGAEYKSALLALEGVTTSLF